MSSYCSIFAVLMIALFVVDLANAYFWSTNKSCPTNEILTKNTGHPCEAVCGYSSACGLKGSCKCKNGYARDRNTQTCVLIAHCESKPIESWTLGALTENSQKLGSNAAGRSPSVWIVFATICYFIIPSITSVILLK